MFKREHHLRIATVLQSLDADLLRSQGCLFGGGTAIALSHGEYRESIDIDFLVSDKAGFRELRQLLTDSDGISAIVRKNSHLALARAIRADQYGIRTMLSIGGVEIKFEIVFEARIELEPAGSNDQICGVSTLTQLDMATSKLLANSDRWSDDSVFSRDLIDLAMLELPSKMRKKAIEKASAAYGKSIERDLKKAVANLKTRRGRLRQCMNSLKITTVPEALMWKRMKDLIGPPIESV